MHKAFIGLVCVLVGAWLSAAPARAQTLTILSGGCNSGNLAATNYPTLTVDANGRLCAYSVPGYSYKNITTDATTTVKSGAGVLHTITFNNPTATEVITVYDNIAASGTIIGTITIPASPQPVTLTYDVAFKTGLTVVTATATGDITVSYQ